MQVNIKQLMAAIHEAAPFTLPEMNEGTSYLFANVYNRLSIGANVTISSLDFSAFDSDDIRLLSDLYDNIFEKNASQSEGIVETLQRISPMCKASAYV